MDKLDSKYLVYTNYDTKADFQSFRNITYRIASLLSATVKTPNIEDESARDSQRRHVAEIPRCQPRL